MKWFVIIPLGLLAAHWLRLALFAMFDPDYAAPEKVEPSVISNVVSIEQYRKAAHKTAAER